MTLDEALDSAQREQAIPPRSLSYAEVTAALTRLKYTGPTTVHWAEGRPAALDVPNPIRVRLDRS